MSTFCSSRCCSATPRRARCGQHAAERPPRAHGAQLQLALRQRLGPRQRCTSAACRLQLQTCAQPCLRCVVWSNQPGCHPPPPAQALPLFLDRLADPLTAVLLSVSVILLFGEVLPQALCSRYGLQVGASSAWFVRLLMAVTSPLSWPMGKLLDWVLGGEHTVRRTLGGFQCGYTARRLHLQLKRAPACAQLLCRRLPGWRSGRAGGQCFVQLPNAATLRRHYTPFLPMLCYNSAIHNAPCPPVPSPDAATWRCPLASPLPPGAVPPCPAQGAGGSARRGRRHGRQPEPG